MPFPAEQLDPLGHPLCTNLCSWTALSGAIQRAAFLALSPAMLHVTETAGGG